MRKVCWATGGGFRGEIAEGTGGEVRERVVSMMLRAEAKAGVSNVGCLIDSSCPARMPKYFGWRFKLHRIALARSRPAGCNRRAGLSVSMRYAASIAFEAKGASSLSLFEQSAVAGVTTQRFGMRPVFGVYTKSPRLSG